ncbi:MAG: enoyl-CoA hydratase/isomerase family protein [Deltaproteobacteria bacterium]|nr:enoyl-CoA hydratase/isomerase family protein [bacterium]MCB9479962.1 enoyl-CoA hydratase/isomerase family protein [Deltaproteobacteria bacterium]MCB9489745.1 enoyl-CoA hydratase/isomerase family protein [Deltaproteobacteria bacterium]
MVEQPDAVHPPEFETLRIVETADVATLTLRRPQVGNLINVTMVKELIAALEWLEDESRASVLVLHGDGDDFCRGIDMTEFEPGKAPDIHGFHKWEKACHALERLNKVTVCMVHGMCVGGGAHLALVCDMRLMHRQAKVCFDEVKRGFIPGLATFRLAKYIGLGRAKSLVLTGRAVGADEALRIGLADRIYEKAVGDPVLEETINEFFPFNADSLELSRRLLNESYAVEYEDFVGHFLAAQHRAISSEAFAEQVRRAHEASKDSAKKDEGE